MANKSGRSDFKGQTFQDIELEDMSRSNNMSVAEAQPSSEVASHSQHGTATDLQNIPQLFAAVPAISEASLRLAQTASYLTRRFSEFVGDPRENSLDAAGPSNVANSYHSRTTQLSQDDNPGTVGSSSTPSSSDSRILNTLSVERATSIITSTGSALMEFGQNFLHFPPTVWQGLVTRIQKTLRGSGEDIGWLQRMPGLAPVDDRTDRFLQILGMVSKRIHKLPNSLVYLLVPGLFSNHGPLYFVDTKKYFSKLGLTCHIAKIHSEAAVETNALELKNYIEELYWGSGKRVMLLGHSKGGVDAAAAIAMYWSDLKDKVAGLALVQSPYGGSPIASDLLREGQVADLETRRFLELLICKIIKGDLRSLDDLTYEKRREFLSRHPLPSDFPTVSFHTEASIAPGVLSTMSHIAHAELPWLSVPSLGVTSEEPVAAAKLPVVIPLAAAMAVCALHLELRYGEKSDGLVVRKDAEVPGSVVVRPDRKLDHAWMVYSPSCKEEKEPNSSQMCEALLTLLLEVKLKLD